MEKNDLIFDFGFHNGDDTDFYLAKGYRVVAVEANTNLYLDGKKRFAKELDNGRLCLINKAISQEKGEISFYVHPTNTDWSSCYHHIVTSDGSQPQLIKVETTTLHDLYRQYGVPHYMKVDIEGADVFVAKQVAEYEAKPEYISFETSRRDFAGLFSYLYVSGFSNFQLINQMNNNGLQVEVKTFFNEVINYKFTRYSSGLFGEDLKEDKWRSFEEVLSNYIKYMELKKIDNKELGLGWVDVHARFKA